MPDPRQQLDDALKDRYRIERELGRGGMATVYLARDLRHDRPVALKLLLPSLAATLGPERFEREIRLAARLQHPHICGVLDSGEAAGQLWFTMPFVEGESLRQRLQRAHQVPLAEAVRITLQAADALEYAHQRGIVHRDVKPENILLTGTHALVADFGVAKALHVAGAATLAQDSITGTGLAIGTPAYMSPEQAGGSRELDARTDVYALGCVLYEMLAGEPPFTGPTVQAIIAKRLATDPTPLSVVRPDISPRIGAIIAQAMHRTPAERYATAGELARDIESAVRPEPTAPAAVQSPAQAGAAAAAGTSPWYRRGLAIFVIGLVVGLGILFAWRRPRAEPPAADTGIKRLAVLPFDNQGAPEDDYFADGITDEVRGKLAVLPGLQVTASRSASSYKGTAKSLQQIAGELGVGYLLVGKVRWEKSGGQSRVRVSPELVDVAKGSTEWQQAFDASLTDVFQVQADIATKVATALNVALSTGEQAQLGARPTANLAAYDAYLRGNEIAAGFAQTSAIDIRRAQGQYERAVALDSTFALAWAMLSRSLSRIAFLGVARGDERDRAKVAAERALALAPQLGTARLALGDYYYNVRNDWRAAVDQFGSAREVAPQDPDVLVSLGRALESANRWDEAVDALRKAQAVDPRSVAPARALAVALLWMRRYPEALDAAARAVQLSPQHPAPRETQAMVHLSQGDLAGARKVIRDAYTELDPTALVIYLAQYWDLYWALEEDQQQLALRLPLGSFDDDIFGRAMVMTELYDLRGDRARARGYADTARVEAELRLKSAPEDPYMLVQHALALAYVGRTAEAVSAADRSLALLSSAQDGYSGPYDEHIAARVYLRSGQPDKAIALLQHLLSIPYFLSPEWLRIDPEWKPLHGNPKFEALLRRSS